MTASEVENLLTNYSAEVRDVALKLRGTILDLIPGATERVYMGWQVIEYGTGAKMADMALAISPQRSYVNLQFSRGSELPDPAGLLEGTGKLIRHTKLRNADAVDNPAVHALIRAAALK